MNRLIVEQPFHHAVDFPFDKLSGVFVGLDCKVNGAPALKILEYYAGHSLSLSRAIFACESADYPPENVIYCLPALLHVICVLHHT